MMYNSGKLFFLFILLHFFLLRNSSQSFSINAGITLPQADYGDDEIENEKSGQAGTGFIINIKYLYPVMNNICLYTGANFNISGINKGVQDRYNLKALNNQEITFSKYINIPFIIGLEYSVKSENISLYYNLALTTNFFHITNMEITYQDENGNIKQTYKYDWVNNVGLKTGVGILIGEKIAIDLSYFALGKHNYNLKYQELLNDEIISKKKTEKTQDITILTLTVGYKF